MPVKPAWKKTEAWLIALLCGGLMELTRELVQTAPGALLNLPAPYSGIIAAIMPVCATGLLAWFAKLRHDAYAGAGIPEPAPQAAQAPPGAKTPAGGTPLVVKSLIIAAALAGAFLAPSRAEAQTYLGPFAVSVGPSLPLLEYSPGNPHPVSVASGAGLMGSLSLPSLQLELFGRAWDMLALNGIAYGTLVSGAAGQQFGELKLAAAVTTLNSLVGIGYSHAVLDNSGAFPKGAGSLVVVLSINFAIGPYAPPLGVAKGASGLMRGNTLYIPL